MLSDEERAQIKSFVTDLDSPVFGFTNLPPVIVGALFGRYSRSELGARELLAREFLANQDFKDIGENLTGKNTMADPAKAEAFYGRVLDQYGDDSVAELGGTALAVEKVTNVLAKIIEDRRIGLSPLEKSSRYVRFDRKDDQGNYPYYTDPDITKAGLDKEYKQTMDLLFDTYSESIPPLMEHLKQRFPQAKEQSDKAYTNALRAQACDVARYLLPMSTQTNVGLVGNGRAFEYLMYCLRATGLAEAHQYADYIHQELTKIIPAFTRRSKTDRGQGYVDHLAQTKMNNQKSAANLTTYSETSDHPTVTLTNFDADGEIMIAAGLAYEASAQPFATVLEHLKKNPDQVKTIIEQALAPRQHRTHKPPRGFEYTYYQFEITCDIGAYRDLHRHRVLTQQRQPFTTALGYTIPKDIHGAGLTTNYTKAMDAAAALYKKVAATLPEQAQYCVLFGYHIRFTMNMNAREAYHLCELRSTVQGHPSYRFVAQEMARLIKEVHPTLGNGMMMTWDGYDELARVASEQKIEQKELARQKKK